MIDNIIKIISDAARVPPTIAINVDTPLQGGGLALDSIAVLELSAALEREYDLAVDFNEMLEAGALKTVGTLASFVSSKASQRG
jgi:acyl carrier protein